MIAVRATHRLVHNFVNQIQSLEAMRCDAKCFGCLFCLLRGFPQNGGATFGADDGINRVLKHEHRIGHRNGQCTARATFTNDGGDDGHFELRHLEDVAANGF